MEKTLVDMDNVIADFDTALLNGLRMRHPEINPRNRSEFLVVGTYPEYTDDIDDIIHSKSFYRDLPVKDGAIDGWARMIQANFSPRVCSAPLVTNEYCVDEKFEWLRRNFVPIFGSSVLHLAEITVDKSSVDGLALIDDKPDIKNSSIASWTHVVYEAPYNLTSPAKYRIEGWGDPRLISILEQIANNKRFIQE